MMVFLVPALAALVGLIWDGYQVQRFRDDYRARYGGK
jgi:hypothetical protein